MNLNNIVENDNETILITHDELLNYIHLLASVLHGVFGKNEYARLSGNFIEPDLRNCWPNIFEKWFWTMVHLSALPWHGTHE